MLAEYLPHDPLGWVMFVIWVPILVATAIGWAKGWNESGARRMKPRSKR